MMKLYFHSSQTGCDYTLSCEQQGSQAQYSTITVLSISLSDTLWPVLMSSPHNYRQLFSLTPSWIENSFSHANDFLQRLLYHKVLYKPNSQNKTCSNLRLSRSLLKLFPNSSNICTRALKWCCHLTNRFKREHLWAKINIRRTGSRGQHVKEKNSLIETEV